VLVSEDYIDASISTAYVNRIIIIERVENPRGIMKYFSSTSKRPKHDEISSLEVVLVSNSSNSEDECSNCEDKFEIVDYVTVCVIILKIYYFTNRKYNSQTVTFSVKMVSDSISEHPIFKIFLGGMPSDPPRKGMLCMPAVCSAYCFAP